MKLLFQILFWGPIALSFVFAIGVAASMFREWCEYEGYDPLKLSLTGVCIAALIAGWGACGFYAAQL